MKISQLVTELEKLKEAHGDLPVVLGDWNEGRLSSVELTVVGATESRQPWRAHDGTRSNDPAIELMNDGTWSRS